MEPAVPHVLHVFATFVPAGPQVRTAKLLADLGSRFRHSIVAMDGRVDAQDLIPASVDARVLEAPPKAGTLRTLPRLARILARERPDVLCTYNWGALDAVLAARWRSFGHVVHHEDGFRPDEAQRRKLRRNWARRIALRSVRTVVVISENLERIARDEWRVPADRLHFVPNGIELARFDPRPADLPDRRRELGLGDAFVVGAVGHLRPEKNVARLLAVLGALPRDLNAHAIVLGEGPERTALEEQARTLGIEERVHFVGYHADPRSWYRAFDAFAITSDTEQAPIALLEAMASSLPVVATDVGDVRAMVPAAGRAAVVDAATEGDLRAALAARLAELAADPELRAERGRAGLERVRERYDARVMTTTYERIWRAAIAPPTAHGAHGAPGKGA